jgi:acyl transferase domain-containing protein/NADPH:quinone reductase-like Zn-dependent oxidoreductase
MTVPSRRAVPIAVVGIGCRLPGGVRDVASYWDLLASARCVIREIPPERWSLDGFYDPAPDRPDRSYSRWAGLIEDIRGFDPAFFGLSQREAEGMDPQQRLLLMAAVEAAQDARLPLSLLRACSTGVFVGVSNVDYGLLQRYRPGHGEQQAGTGTALSIVANRVSNRLDLSGPSMGIDTACSSALVAVDTACRHLADGSCDLALAGGVSILLDPRMFITFSRAHMLSPTGRLRAFDAAADGFVRGEGVGIVLLRRLDEAAAAGDRIYAVIEATAVNQDGRTGTITEPSCEAQIAMLRAAMARACASPGDLAYVEAHGTGTPVGDPIEARAIGTVLGGAGGRTRPLPIGSVKTNIGHLEPAAGIAGLIKAALVLSRGEIPPSLGFERSSTAVDLDSLGLVVAQTAMPLDGTHAVVNSFGFGGTNSCAVLSAAPRRASPPRGPVVVVRDTVGHEANHAAPRIFPLSIFPLSGPTPRHLEASAARLLRALDDGAFRDVPLPKLAAALAVQRDHAEHRAVVIARTPGELRDRLACLAEGRDWPAADRHAPPQIVRGRARTSPRLVLTMTGQGGQWWAMGRELIEREPAFRATFDELDRHLVPAAGWSSLAELTARENASRIDDAAITPAVMLGFQLGLAEIWRRRGVAPDIVLGHSFGEVTAACLAGALSLPDAARLVTHRGLIRHRVDRRGTMAAIGLGAEAIAPLLPADGSIEIGGYNSPDMVTLTGEEAAIDALIADLNARDPAILTRKLALDFAYHSSWFEPVEAIFKQDVGTLVTSPPRLPVVSTVTGRLNEDFSADYWWRNLRWPVLYQRAIETALGMGGDVFLELGPHRTLSGMTAACAAGMGRDVTTISTLDRRWGDLVSLAVATAQLWVAGVRIDWPALLESAGRDVALPAQPWLLREIWHEPEEAARHMRPPRPHSLLGRRIDGAAAVWRADLSLASHPWLADHRLDGTCVMPAAAWLEMLISAGREVLSREAIELVDVEMPAALYVGADDEIVLETRYDVVQRRLEIHSRSRGLQVWELRTRARLYEAPLREPGAVASPSGPPPAPNVESYGPAVFYRAAAEAGYGWGPGFQGLKSIERHDGGASGSIDIGDGEGGFAFDPRLVDSALQLMLASGDRGQPRGVIPAGIARVLAYGRAVRHARADVEVRPAAGSTDVIASVRIEDESGALLSIERLHARPRMRPSTAHEPAHAAPQLLVELLEPIELPAAATSGTGEAWLIVSDAGESAVGMIANALGERAASVVVHPTARPEALIEIVRSGAWEGIVYAAPLGQGGTCPEDIGATATRLSVSLTVFGQALAGAGSSGALPPVTILTRGARPGGELTDAGLAHAALLGIARTIAMEVPALNLRLLDLDPANLDDPDLVRAALTSPTPETEIVLRAGRAFAPRLVRRGPEELPALRRRRGLLRPGSGFALRREGAIGIDGLLWREASVRPPGPGEVRIEVRAVGLNFRDVMAVAGLLPPDAEPVPALETLGLELAGVVAELGPGVDDISVGAPVLGMGTAALQRFVTWPCAAVQPMPVGLSFVEAATLPSVYLTAHHALNVIGRMAPGETVLIHSAAGGVGLAAIALARRAGARVIATAGTDEKRAHLRGLGIAHVLDSRSLAFAPEVRRITGGRGVDLVLNALGGAFIDKGLSCLAPYGRFVELGKRDVWGDGGIALKALRANASLHVVDVAALLRERPAEAARGLAEVLHMLARGEIAPLPVTVHPANRVREAFAQLAGARHIGKVVVDMDDETVEVERDQRGLAPLDPEGAYLVTGGTRGFGQTVARWLLEHGAGRVVVASRSAGAGGESRPGIDLIPLDVTDAAAVDRAIDALALGPYPLRGVVHAAVVYDDAMLAGQTPERVRRVMAPKVEGALNLTRAVERAGLRLDFLVMLSSLAQVVGWPGQASYAAANSFLEGLAERQRARGMAAQCINLGALGESGHVARSGQMQGYLDSAGWIAMPDADVLAAIGRALALDAPVLTIAAADWERLAAAYPAIARAPRLAHLAGAISADASTRSPLARLAGAAREAAALDLVREAAAKVLRAAPSDLVAVERLDDAGIDSLSSFELRNRLGHAIGRELPMSRYAAARTFPALAALVAEIAGDPAGGAD